jgi:TatA/E family protein of Tat protein translocase
MFGLGFWEIAIILAIALIVLGPSKLPELARGLGKGLREFRKATEDFKSTIENEVNRPEPLPPPKGQPEQIAQIVPADQTVPHDPHAHAAPVEPPPAPAAPAGEHPPEPAPSGDPSSSQH